MKLLFIKKNEIIINVQKKLCLKRLSPTLSIVHFFLVGLQSKKTKKLKELKFQACHSREELHAW